MTPEDVLPFALAFVSLGAYFLGGEVRRHVHVLLPTKDPATLALAALALVPFFLGYMSLWYAAFLLTFFCCYSLAYVREEFDMAYVNVHTIISDRFPNGAQEIRPVVYYWDKNGQQCYQDQSLKEIIKTVVFGIHTPLRLDTGMVRRTRPVFVHKVLFPEISVDAIDVVEEVITESEVKKWRIRFKVRSVSYTPAPSCIDTTQQWLVSAYNQDALLKEVTRKDAQLLEAKVTAMTGYYAKSADLLVEMISDRTPGSEVYQDIISRLAPDEPEEITLREPVPPPDAPRAKRRSVLRRRPPEAAEPPEEDE